MTAALVARMAAVCWVESTDHSVLQRATSNTRVRSKKSKIGEQGLTLRKWARCDSIARFMWAARARMQAGIDTLVRGVAGFAVLPSCTALVRIKTVHET